VPPVNKLKVITSLEKTKRKLLHNRPLKFGTVLVPRVFVGGIREQMMITIGLMCIKTLCRTEQKVLSGKREIVKKMSTNLMFGFYYSLC
jgi:hypothetical protein